METIISLFILSRVMKDIDNICQSFGNKFNFYEFNVQPVSLLVLVHKLISPMECDDVGLISKSICAKFYDYGNSHGIKFNKIDIFVNNGRIKIEFCKKLFVASSWIYIKYLGDSRYAVNIQYYDQKMIGKANSAVVNSKDFETRMVDAIKMFR